MLNYILSFSRFALLGVAMAFLINPFSVYAWGGSPYQDPSGDKDDDNIPNSKDICPFDYYLNDYHRYELEKYGVELINYDALIEFLKDGIDWDAEFHRHDSWIDNAGGQIGNVASVINMVVLQAEKMVVNTAGLFGRKPPYAFDKAKIKTIDDLNNLIQKTEDFADHLFGLSKITDLDFRIKAKYDKREIGKIKKPTLVLMAASILYENASTKYAEAAESSKQAYRFLTSKKYRDREVKADPIE
ncbi:MAG: hypothetical protein OXH84_01630 [Gammaproteobacteria bacterium]|nr:hypothetical protein [Gammaproteobacteria bacterium]